jgi:predicted homoserine dehydrogenase-like protein
MLHLARSRSTISSSFCRISSHVFSSASTRPARVVVVGSGRMGHIRSSLVRANPRFELVGIVDTAMEGAERLAETYRVSDNLALPRTEER